MNGVFRFRLLAGAAALLAVAGSSDPAVGQSVGIGYVANAPDALVGGKLYTLFKGDPGARWGLYLDAKFDISSRSDEGGFLDDMTASEAEALGDAFFISDETWSSVNLALMREVSSEMTVYAGAGWARRTNYAEYLDSSRELGLFGFYWVKDERLSTTTVNILGGIMLQISRQVRVQVGLESAPVGATVGISYLLEFGDRTDAPGGS